MLQSPCKIYPLKCKDNEDYLDAVNPQFDYVPPEYITLYITNDGPQTPSYLYNKFKELYSQEDYYIG